MIGTYSRHSARKHACLEAMADWGLDVPDTPPMAVHRGRIDLLDRHLSADPGLLSRRFSLTEIFPPELRATENSALEATPLDGVTLLHMAVDFDEDEIVRWLLDRGADPNATASVGAEGFGGQAALPYRRDRKDNTLTAVLLGAGANPRARATLRKHLRDTGDPEKEQVREFRDVTPVEYARQCAEPTFVNDAAVKTLTRRRL